MDKAVANLEYGQFRLPACGLFLPQRLSASILVNHSAELLMAPIKGTLPMFQL